ncbi:hypothetical protein [Nostocoides sp. HKS02]|uniref:hypothetical protein n=1 Tax=Nostocoides sp. HKS02 TaxID=1813880 RepID=UPI0012B444E6|nr:hypothetical protein [Tetrasphaera sp. HKS02]QGN57476.1 hypothetical protein GKE56_05870 [Tetrasphaera sp. HKS02]
MDTHQSHLQEDGTTFPPVTRDTPQTPDMVIPEVPDPTIVAPEGDAEGDADGDSATDAPD